MKIYARKKEKECLIDLFVMTYDTIDVTKDFIKSLYSNTSREDFHLILLDNGSRDGTEEYLKSFHEKEDNISIIINDKNDGPMIGRNKCYDYCKTCKQSPLIAFLDNDQFVKRDWLPHHLKVLKNGNDLIGVEAWQFNNYYIPILKISSPNQYFNYVGTGGMLFKKEIPEKIGQLMDERYCPAYYEDPDFCFEAYKFGYKIGWNYNAKIIHLAHKTLGKIPQKEKSIIFQNSWKKFKDKWKDFKMPILKQDILKEI